MYNEKYTEYDKLVYEKELKDFLPDEFIDFHTHVQDKNMNGYGSHNGGSSWTDLIAKDGSDVELLLDSYKEMFPSQKVTPLIFGGCLCDIDKVNDYVYNKGAEYKLPTLYRTDYAMDADKLEEDILKRGFLGIKPYLSNCPSYILSKIILMTSCNNLSSNDGMPNGRFFPFFLGIYTLRAEFG